jgi:hypothetical protein
MQLNLFGEEPKPEIKKPSQEKPIREPFGLTGDILSNIRERIRNRKLSLPDKELTDWIESNWHHGKFNDNTGYDVAMLILLGESTEEIKKLFNNEQKTENSIQIKKI